MTPLQISFILLDFADWYVDNFGTVLLLIVAITMLIVWMAVSHGFKQSEQRKVQMQSQMKQIAFSPTAQYHDSLNRFIVGIDEWNQKVLFQFPDHQHILDFKDILSVKLVENGSTIISRSTAEVVKRTLVGGFIGGLTAKQHAVQSHYDIHVDVTTRKFDLPTITLTFLDYDAEGPSPVDIDNANKVVSLINIVIDRVAQEEATKQQPPTPTPPEPVSIAGISVADELRKLADLHSAGILTDAEFQDQKQRLLSQNN